jgi:hypothetical protein
MDHTPPLLANAPLVLTLTAKSPQAFSQFAIRAFHILLPLVRPYWLGADFWSTAAAAKHGDDWTS